MRILIVTNSKISLGAGVLAKDFAMAFGEKGVETKILVHQYSGESDEVLNIQAPNKTKAISLLRNLVNNPFVKSTLIWGISMLNKIFKFSNGLVFKTLHKSKYVVQDIDQTKNIYSTDFLLEKTQGFTPDAIVVMFMQNFINYQNLYELGKAYDNVPICISMLDMAPITGGCHYAWDCIGYQSNCNNCPAVPPSYQQFITNNLAFKKNVSEKGNFNYFFSSTSQELELKKSTVASHRNLYQISLPIDEKQFNNDQNLRAVTRNALGFEADDMVMFFGAMNLSDPRKGGGLLMETLKIILAKEELSELKFLVIGGQASVIEEIVPRERLRTLDVVAPGELPKYYNASDFFVSPSVADAGPMMVNQSVMCGTRVCAFNIGVAIDLVKDIAACGRTADNTTSQEMYDLIKQEYDFQMESKKTVLRNECAESAFGLTSKSAVSEKWINIIGSIISKENE